MFLDAFLPVGNLFHARVDSYLASPLRLIPTFWLDPRVSRMTFVSDSCVSIRLPYHPLSPVLCLGYFWLYSKGLS